MTGVKGRELDELEATFDPAQKKTWEDLHDARRMWEEQKLEVEQSTREVRTDAATSAHWSTQSTAVGTDTGRHQP